MSYCIVNPPAADFSGTIELVASKSESNRILIINALCREPFDIYNLSQATDTTTLKKILEEDKNSSSDQEKTYSVGNAGTAMRFCIAYFATKPCSVIMTGDERMKKRPVGILVEALRDLGADIEYLEQEGYPPVKIQGRELMGGEILLDPSISSQYTSALLLVSPRFFNGIVLHLTAKALSSPYITMTLRMMEQFGVVGQWNGNMLSVSKQEYSTKFEDRTSYTVEADWSSASYYYSLVALSKSARIVLKGLRKDSIQGDAVISFIFSFLGVRTEFTDEGVVLTKSNAVVEQFAFDFSDCPDLAQTVAVTVSALKVPTILNGLSTLRIKETDRIQALITELKKLNVNITVENDSLIISPENLVEQFNGEFDTYEDHRMAMSLAPLCFKYGAVRINNPKVVEKSYPAFWKDISSAGMKVEMG